MTKRKQKNRVVIKGIIFLVAFLTFFVVMLFTKAPAYFDSYVFYEDYKFKAHLFLIGYRVVVYLVFPLVMSTLEKLFSKRKKVSFFNLLIENFNIQFCLYALIAGIYVLFGLDKVLGVDIFGSSDIFVFVTGFVFTVILKKNIPSLVYDENDISSELKK